MAAIDWGGAEKTWSNHSVGWIRVLRIRFVDAAFWGKR